MILISRLFLCLVSCLMLANCQLINTALRLAPLLLLVEENQAALAVIFSICLTSCGTLGGLMNSYPIRILDQTGSALLGYLAENELPADGAPASIQQRARQVEERGIYAGHAPAAAMPRQSMASR